MITLVLLSPEPDLSIVDVDAELSQAGTGRDTDRVPDPRAPGGEDTGARDRIGVAQGCSSLPGSSEPLLVPPGAAAEHLLTRHCHEAS